VIVYGVDVGGPPSNDAASGHDISTSNFLSDTIDLLLPGQQ